MSTIPIKTNNAPTAIGPYEQGVISGGFVFTSGQIPLHHETGEIVGTTIEEQTKQVLQNLVAVLAAANTSPTNVIKTTCFLSDMGHFAQFNEVYSKYFKAPFPARSCVAVKTLPKNVLVEIEAIARI